MTIPLPPPGVLDPFPLQDSTALPRVIKIKIFLSELDVVAYHVGNT